MAADLQPAGLGRTRFAWWTIAVDEPEHAALDLGQRVQARGFLLKLGHGGMTT